jgi:hypothetical protein
MTRKTIFPMWQQGRSWEGKGWIEKLRIIGKLERRMVNRREERVYSRSGGEGYFDVKTGWPLLLEFVIDKAVFSVEKEASF